MTHETSSTRTFHRLGLVASTMMLVMVTFSNTRAENLVEHANRGLVELETAGGDGASIAMAQDIADVLDDGATRRILPVVGRGAVQNIIDIKALRGIDMGIVQTDVIEHAKKTKVVPIDGVVTYIAKLHNEEFHLLAGKGVSQVEDLAGKRVNFAGGATITGPALFDALHVKVEPVLEDNALALEKLKSGEIAALAYVAAKPTALFNLLSAEGGVHFISIPLKAEMTTSYVPARITAEDYPRLVTANAPVDTVAVGTVLIVANLAPNTDRYRNVANFVDAFFTQFPRLQEVPHHPKWSEVNLAAEYPALKRFAPADQWLKRNVVASAPALDEKELRDVFTKFIDERSKLSGGKTLSSQEKDQLFDQFRHWQSTQAR